MVEVRTANRIGALTRPRFLPAFTIILHHLQGEMILPHIGQMDYGVSLFFVLSGFVLQHTYGLSKQPVSFPSFMTLRIARIWLMHLAAIGLILLFFGAPVVQFISHTYSIIQIVSVVVLVQAWATSTVTIFVLNGPSWSISAELSFYLTFPFLSRFVTNAPLSTLLLVTIAALVTLLTVVVLMGRGFAGECPYHNLRRDGFDTFSLPSSLGRKAGCPIGEARAWGAGPKRCGLPSRTLGITIRSAAIAHLR